MEEYTPESSTNSFKISKINSGMLTNLTLNQLWFDFFKAYRNVNYKLGNHNLDCIWIILSGDVKEKNEMSNYIAIETKLSGLPYLGMPEKKGFQKLTEKDKASLITQRSIIMEKACFLRKLQDKQGKGTAYDDGDDELAE
jgi:hypothetical protein